MTSKSRQDSSENAEAIVQRLQERVVEHLKAHGPQPWDTLVVKLSQSRTGHIHMALKELQEWKTIKVRRWMIGLTEDVSSFQQLT